MRLIRLHRPAPLTLEEGLALPAGARVAEPAARAPDGETPVAPAPDAPTPGGDEVLTFPADLPLDELLGLAYVLGSAVPGGVLTVDAAQPGEAGAGGGAGAQAAAQAQAPLEPGTDPWKLVDAGDPRAEQLLTGQPLDSAGRSRVQAMLARPEAATVALGCRIARWTDWKSGVQLIRRLVAHPDPAVRRDAVVAIGELAGPSLTMTIRPLRTDPDPEVRAAAIAVLKRFGD